MKKLTLILFIGSLLVSTNTLALEPLSCKIQVMLHVVAAMRRDDGASKQDQIDSYRKSGELTNKEINQIVNNVHIKYKTKSPDEIANIVARQCG